MTAVGLFITVLKNGRMASLQEQMALHAWHNFLRQTRTRTVNTGFACCSHPHQNITMKTSDKNVPAMSVFNSGLEAVSAVIKNTGLGVS